MAFKITKATRTGIIPLIGLYGKSGGGKTHSALLLARGLVGDKGRITLIDTENKRGHIFSDVVPGGYNVLDFEPPYSPFRFREALQLAEKESDIVVIDSLTHSWDGEGGVLNMQDEELTRMAGTDFKKREACKMASWIKPKKEHKLFISQILRTPIPIICCLRGDEKVVWEKAATGTKEKTFEILGVKYTLGTQLGPIFDKRFIFEMLINGEVYAKEGKGGYVNFKKITHQNLSTCLPKSNQQVTVEHGRMIAEWCGGANKNVGHGGTATLKGLKAKLWKDLKPVRQLVSEDIVKVDEWLKENNVTQDGIKSLDTDEKLKEAIDMVEILLSEYREV